MVKKVLVVEDTAVTRFSLKQMLEEEGYEVEEAATGEEALSRVAAHPEPFDLIILDIMLPGMDGLAVLREFKARPKSRYTPVMVLTASSSVATVRRALDLGAVEYLVKPYSPKELLRRVEKLIGPGVKTKQAPLENLFGVVGLELNRARRSGSIFSLLLARRGGSGGRRMAELEAYIKRRLRDIDTVMGLDGQTLALVLPVTGADGAAVVADKLASWLAALEPEARWHFGTATYPEGGNDPASLYETARTALLRASAPQAPAKEPPQENPVPA